MVQSGKKNLALFQTLRKEMAAKAKAARKTDVPNLQESLVEVHVHDGTKRKAELPPRPGKGKDVKRWGRHYSRRGRLVGRDRPARRRDRSPAWLSCRRYLLEKILRSTSQIPSSTPLTVWRRIILWGRWSSLEVRRWYWAVVLGICIDGK